MFIKKVKCVDFRGNEYEQTLYFNLSRPELIRMNMDEYGNAANILTLMVEAKNNREMWYRFEEFLLGSYGELSADGRHLEKRGGELARQWTETPAYEAMLDWLLEDQKHVEEFVTGVMPKDNKQDNKPELAVIK